MKSKAAVNIIKTLLFAVMVFFAILGVNRILEPKWLEFQLHNRYTAFEGFYSMEKDSVDVLLLGSSQVFYTISPNELYEKYGIRSYNLGSPGQNLVDSRYILEEAIKTQKVDTVVFESLYLIRDIVNIWHEGAHRKAIEPMRFSLTKVRAINEVHRATPVLEPKSFYFRDLYFHSRWSELTMEDFISPYLMGHTQTKGHLPIRMEGAGREYTPLEGETEVSLQATGIVEKNFNELVDICRKNDINLVMFRVPNEQWTLEQHSLIKQIAEKNDVPFYDFNEKELYERLENFDNRIDVVDDNGHTNIAGSNKLTDLLGKILVEEEGVTAKEDHQWDVTSDYYALLNKNENMKSVTDVDRFLELINDDRYTIMVGKYGEISEKAVNECAEYLGRLGLKDVALSTEGNYIGVIENGKVVYEGVSPDDMSYAGFLENGIIYYKVDSQHDNAYITVEDLIGRYNCSWSGTGFNILVYDSRNMQAVDSVVFNTEGETIIKRG